MTLPADVWAPLTAVMPGLVPGIHAGPPARPEPDGAWRRRVDGRVKPGHDG